MVRERVEVRVSHNVFGEGVLVLCNVSVLSCTCIGVFICMVNVCIKLRVLHTIQI